MSLKLTLQTTLDFDAEFQSLMDTMVLLSNFFKQQQKLQELNKQQRDIVNDLNAMNYLDRQLTDLDELLGFVGEVEPTDAVKRIEALGSAWSRHLYLNPNRKVLDMRYERTRAFLRSAEIKMSVDESGYVIFTKHDKSYPLNIKNLYTINKLIESSKALLEVAPPEYKRSATVDDIMNHDARLFAYTELSTMNIRNAIERVYGKYVNRLAETRIKTIEANQTIKKAKLRAGYTILRDLGRK